MPQLKRLNRHLYWLLGWLLLVGLTAVLAVYTAKHNVAQQLDSQLPLLTETSLQGSHGYASQILPQLQQHLNRQLLVWQQQRTLSMVQCQVQLLQIAEGSSPTASLSWQGGLSSFHAEYDISCQPAVSVLVPLVVVLSLMVWLVWRFYLVLSPALVALQQRLHSQGVTLAEQSLLLQQIATNWRAADWHLFLRLEPATGSQFAFEITQRCCGQQLNETDIAWLLFAAVKYPNQPQQVFEIALGEDELRLQLSSGKVWIRGIELTLSATPMLYFYWYASQRKNTEQGWVLNPASNKPNTEYGAQLQQLMVQGPGHKKAITDIEQGAKAKTLDQNRSKIRDELTQQLGPELAQLYLFDCHKDVKTGRFCYRLMTAPQRIKLLQ